MAVLAGLGKGLVSHQELTTAKSFQTLNDQTHVAKVLWLTHEVDVLGYACHMETFENQVVWARMLYLDSKARPRNIRCKRQAVNLSSLLNQELERHSLVRDELCWWGCPFYVDPKAFKTIRYINNQTCDVVCFDLEFLPVAFATYYCQYITCSLG